ncbi:blh [Symbiodinium necroappetens]|uniref:Blh protein n=1 Tax=Symbiodinium necroappetens TaxID=1628268 RepID=A0A812Y8T6_9DINO|nr:blh [Symbiodinium necroappetens]
MCTGLFDDGVEVWEAMMQDWYSGPHPVPNTEIGSDFDEAADVFVPFLSVVPGSEADALTRLQLAFAFESDLGKHAGLNGSMALVHEHLVADTLPEAKPLALQRGTKDSVILGGNQTLGPRDCHIALQGKMLCGKVVALNREACHPTLKLVRKFSAQNQHMIPCGDIGGGDTIFMPDYGSARCDFPGGSARTLYSSIQRIMALPDDTRVFVGHDYLPQDFEILL